MQNLYLFILSLFFLAYSAVHGNWGEWALPGPCSSACGEGLQMSVRLCDNPAPNYGGKYCEGTNARTQECRSQCPGNTNTQ